MPSSRLSYHVALVRSDVSEEHIASNIRVEIISEANIGSYKSHTA
jgi:hypothetical protein